MKEFLVVIIVLSTIALTIFLIYRKITNSTGVTKKRIPQRIDLEESINSLDSRFSPTRIPSMVNDSEYLSFRNCPDCHSENTVANQYIFRLGPHEFVCRRCGCSFKF